LDRLRRFSGRLKSDANTQFEIDAAATNVATDEQSAQDERDAINATNAAAANQ
jgi:hypothetical protein